MKTKSANLLPFSLNLAHQVNKESKEKPTLDHKYTKKSLTNLHTQTASAEFKKQKKITSYTETNFTCTLNQ